MQVRVAGGRFDAALPDGTWSVQWWPDEPLEVADGGWRFGDVVVDGADRDIDLPIEGVAIGGTLEILGATLGEISEDAVELELWDLDGGVWRVSLRRGEETWATVVPPGVYQAVAGNLGVGQDLVVEGPTQFDLVYEPVEVPWTFTVDGGAPPDGWYLTLEDRQNGVGTWFAGGAGTLTTHAGTYDVTLHADVGDGRIDVTLAEGLALTGAPLALDLPLVDVDAGLRWSGRSMDEGDSVVFVRTDGTGRCRFDASRGQVSASLPPGTYDVYLGQTLDSSELFTAVARGFVLDEDVEVGFRAQTHAVTLAATLDGVATEAGRLLTHDLATNASVLHEGEPGLWEVELPAGTYTWTAAWSEVTADGTEHAVPLGVCVGVE